MKVKVSDLPKDILKKLPVSLVIQKEIETKTLPTSLKYEIENFIKGNSSFQVKDVNEKIYDIGLEKGLYDIKYILDVKNAVITYIKNFLLTRKGTYPFDPEFGTNLYKYIQTKDLDYVGYAISNELSVILDDISQMFNNTSIEIENLVITPSISIQYSSYIINIDLKINDKKTSLNLHI